MSQDDYAKRAEEAAKNFSENDFQYWKTQTIKTNNPTLRPASAVDAFVKGVQWARENPPPEVMALKEALTSCLYLGAFDVVQQHNLIESAREALRRFEERGK